MFGRKKKQAATETVPAKRVATDEVDEIETEALDQVSAGDDAAVSDVSIEADSDDGTEASAAHDASGEDDDEAADGAEDDEVEDDGAEVDDDEDEADEWEELENSRDWREDGPFDDSEVELEGDGVERIDFGSLILTPTDGLQLQLQVDQETNAIQAALAMLGNSGLEIALFAAPRSGGMAADVRREMLASVEQTGGTVEFAEGPFGVEVRRVVPVRTPEGEDALHISRVWLAQGPRWMLRGVLMGEACISEDPSAQHDFIEFFKNIVVRRGNEPLPPGDLIAMTLPDALKPENQS